VIFPAGTTRVFVTGNAGSGKTTFAALLADRLSLPYHGIDGVVWQEGWRRISQREEDEMLNALAAADAWVIDVISDRILQAADVVVFLDVPRSVSAWRAMRRSLRYLFRSRPGLPARCPEVLVIPKLTRIIWRFPRDVRPRILSEIDRRPNGTFIHLAWPQGGDRLLDELSA
jgi:adenylate kinase family enzyme